MNQSLTQSRRTLLIDTDTASDDAVALIMALRSPLVEVVAITTVAGNVPVEQATQNALYTVELCEVDVPVYTGASAPLRRPLESATWFHGKDGLGDHGYKPLTRRARSRDAVDAIIAAVHDHPGLEIITLGPLTNLARAMTRDPSMTAKIGRCVVMGGAPCCEGNVTPAAEYNMWVDPEAARMVFLSGLSVELVGWQLSRGEAILTSTDIEAILALRNPLADFAIECNRTGAAAYHTQTGEHGISLPDPVAMAILLDPELCRSFSEHYVAIEVTSSLTRGMTVVDRLDLAGDERNATTWAPTLAAGARARICWTLDVAGWKAALLRALT